MIKRQLKTLLFLAFAAVAWQGASAQHTLGFTAGYGMASSRLDPKQEMKAIWGSYTAGLTWRYYGQQRFVGGFGIDLGGVDNVVRAQLSSQRLAERLNLGAHHELRAKRFMKIISLAPEVL